MAENTFQAPNKIQRTENGDKVLCDMHVAIVLSLSVSQMNLSTASL